MKISVILYLPLLGHFIPGFEIDRVFTRTIFYFWNCASVVCLLIEDCNYLMFANSLIFSTFTKAAFNQKVEMPVGKGFFPGACHWQREVRRKIAKGRLKGLRLWCARVKPAVSKAREVHAHCWAGSWDRPVSSDDYEGLNG